MPRVRAIGPEQNGTAGPPAPGILGRSHPPVPSRIRADLRARATIRTVTRVAQLADEGATLGKGRVNSNDGRRNRKTAVFRREPVDQTADKPQAVQDLGM